MTVSVCPALGSVTTTFRNGWTLGVSFVCWSAAVPLMVSVAGAGGEPDGVLLLREFNSFERRAGDLGDNRYRNHPSEERDQRPQGRWRWPVGPPGACPDQKSNI